MVEFIGLLPSLILLCLVICAALFLIGLVVSETLPELKLNKRFKVLVGRLVNKPVIKRLLDKYLPMEDV